jgi:hypothetical protein
VKASIIYVKGSYIRCWNGMHCCCSALILTDTQQLAPHTTQTFPAVASNNGTANHCVNDINVPSQGCPYKDCSNVRSVAITHAFSANTLCDSAYLTGIYANLSQTDLQIKCYKTKQKRRAPYVGFRRTYHCRRSKSTKHTQHLIKR